MTKPASLTAPHVDVRLDLAEVYATHARDVMRWAVRLSGRPDDAGDVTHEVFEVVQRRLPGFDSKTGALTTWLFRITANVVRSRRRLQRLRAFFSAREEEGLEVASPARGPDEVVMASRDAALVYRVLDQLGEVDRAMLVLFEFEGESGEQVAELLDLKPSTIWVRLHRARQRFLSKLEALEPRR